MIGVQIAQQWKWFLETVLIIVALNVRISILATDDRETEYVEADCSGIKKYLQAGRAIRFH